jgi:hypothetical protein
MSNVVQIASQSRVDEAWDEYLELYDRAEANPQLRRQRHFANALIVAHEKYRVLYLMWVRGQ